MRATIVVDDNIMSVDGGKFRVIDCADLAKDGIHAVQWHGVYGEVEHKGGFDIELKMPTRKPNQFIDDFSAYEKYARAYAIEDAKMTAIEKRQDELRQIHMTQIEAWKAECKKQGEVLPIPELKPTLEQILLQGK